MNKKLKIMVPALVMTVALMGAGYAAWTEKDTVTTNLSTGELKVQFEYDADDSFYAEDAVTRFAKGQPGNNYVIDYDNSGATKKYEVPDPKYTGGAKQVGNNCVYTIAPTGLTKGSNSQAVAFNFMNMHPGTMAKTRFEFRNLGTIPARVTGVKVSFPGMVYNADTIKLKNAIRVNYTFNKHHDGESGTTPFGSDSNVTLAGLENSLKANLIGESKVINPDDEIGTKHGDELEVSTMDFYIPANLLNGNEGENSAIPVQIEFEFGQYNQLVTP